MAKLSFWKILSGGILFAVIAYIVHNAGAVVGLPYYKDPAYFNVWSELMMPADGPPPPEFAYASFVFSLIIGVVLALAYNIVRKSMIGKTISARGIFYGFLIFLIAGIPSAISLYLLINLPSMLILFWAFENLVIYLVGGIAIAWLNQGGV